MKTLIALWICTSVVLLRGQEPEWKYEAAYGIGYADYSEQGSYYFVKSDWSAWAGDLMFEAQRQTGTFFPYIRAYITASEQEVEEWENQGGLAQKNDMSMAGINFNIGLDVPQQLGKSTVIPSLGIHAGYQSFVRENFVRLDGLSQISGTGGKVTEQVQSYGVGGGVAFEVPLGENWMLGAETAGYWFFYTYADNDGYDTGIEGDGGLSWESSISLAKKLHKPGQMLGLKLYSNMQWINGNVVYSGSGGEPVEWPDNDWRILSLSLFWRGEF